jgi:hypothetical protein
MDAQYRLTYDDANAPTHYGWKQPSRLERLEQQLNGKAAVPAAPADPEPEVRRILAALDAQGRWISVYDGEALVGQPKFARQFPYLSSAAFSRNLEALSAFLLR